MEDRLKSLIEQDEKEFSALIQRMNNLKKYREGLLVIDFNMLKENAPMDYWRTFLNFYKGFCFFPDDEIKAKLKSCGLTDEDLIYFTPLQDILNELYKIWNDDNIIPVKQSVLESIKHHYDIKIGVVIIKRMEFTAFLNGKKDATKLKKALYNIKRRRDDDRKGGLKSFRTFLDEYAYTLLMVFDTLTDTPEKNQQFLLSVSDGDTKIFLRRMVESHDYINMTNDAFLRKFYPLFRLIVKDGPYLPDEDGFCQLQGYIGKSFEAFQTIKVKDIIY